MAINIYEAYDLSVELLRKGEQVEAAIYHALQRDIDYPHDAQRMLAFWHNEQIPTFGKSGRTRGYPIKTLYSDLMKSV